MNWKVGDRAIVLHANHRELIGRIVTITSGLVDRPPGKEPWKGGMYCYMTDIQSVSDPSRFAGFQEHNLGPIPDNGSWDEIEKTLEWNPTKLVTVENDNDHSKARTA